MNKTNQQLQEVRLATPKQVAMLERLFKDTDTKIDRPFESLKIEQASALIDEMLEKINGSRITKTESREAKPVTVAPKPANREDNYAKSARFGMAFKLTFQKWTIRAGGCVQGVPDDKHETFIADVIKTYGLINEAAAKAGI